MGRLARDPYLDVEVVATVGNGRLLAGIDGSGQLRTLSGPHLDYPQHLRSSRVGVTVGSGKVQWLDNTGWRHQPDYLAGTNVLRIHWTHAALGIELEQRMAAVEDTLVIGLRLHASRSRQRHRIVWAILPQVGGQVLANALEYFPTSDVLLVSHRELAMALTSTPAADVVKGQSEGTGGGGESQGGGHRFTAVGIVSAQLECAFGADGVTVLLCGLGAPPAVAAKAATLRDRFAGSSDWPLELASPPLGGATRAAVLKSARNLDSVQPAASECYARSILTIAQFTDRSGAMIAGPPIDSTFKHSGGYAYCWPRDGAFIAHALDTVGERGAARAFFEWALAIQPSDGIWKQRYYADGVQAPSWAEHQLDEAGTVLWALDQHLKASFDRRLERRGLNAAMSVCRGVSALAAKSGWPPITNNLWEDQEGAHLYSLVALLAGFTAWRERATNLEDRDATTTLGMAEAALREALASWPVDQKTGALARAVIRTDRDDHPDFTPDSSLIGLSVPFGILSADDPKLQATIRAIERDLRLPSDRVLRYRGDTYRDGNPWPLAGLWLAWHERRAGRDESGLRLYQRALSDRTPAGLLAEQVDAHTGRARWVVPLPWAHAWFLLTTHAMMQSHETSHGDFFFTNGTSPQAIHRARALVGGIYHDGLAIELPGGNARVEAVVATDLRPKKLTAQLATGTSVSFKRARNSEEGSHWVATLPAARAKGPVRYRVGAELDHGRLAGVWASESDPQPGGQQFLYEPSPPWPPDWTADAIGYHVMVDRFARVGNAPWPPWRSATDLYGGTFDGVREHLDHISSLGANLLWLSPVFESPSHHGYDQEDHFEVQPRYGGAEALQRLIGAAHARGMRVILDFVPNHTGRGHPLFMKALRDPDAATAYRFWQWPHYYRSFFDHITLPELDTSRPDMQAYLIDVARRWFRDFGIDGLRCDHVPGVDPSFWIGLRHAVRELKPDALVLGEVTGSDKEMAAYAGRLDGVIDFGFARLVRAAFGEQRLLPNEFDHLLNTHERELAGLVRATFLDNHDMNRFLWVAGGDTARLKLAAAALMTLGGMPMLYYGTEVGLSQRRDGRVENAEARMPMPWGPQQNRDVLAHFERLGQLRRSSPSLRRGTRDVLIADGSVYAFRRSLGSDHIDVLLNFSNTRMVRTITTTAAAVVDQLHMAAITRNGSGVSVELPPLGAAVLADQAGSGGDGKQA